MNSSSNLILYIDDDADDVALLQQAIHTLGSSYELQSASDGEEGLELLSEMKNNGTLPSLIVLDINMPRMDGRMTFKRLKADQTLASIPVVIFSTSNNPMDRMFFQHKNVEYITKPVVFSHLLSVAKRLLQYVEE